jgi:hypothetical protein
MHLPIGSVEGERVAVFLQKDNGVIVGAAIKP